MRTRLFILGTIAAMLLSCGQKADKNSSNPDATAKEIAQEIADTKSYYIEYKTTMDMQGMKSTSVSKQWIDIKNDRLVMETETENEMMGQKTKESALTIGKDGYTYVISLTNKTGLKMKYTILLPLVALLLISCNNTAETKSQTKETIKN